MCDPTPIRNWMIACAVAIIAAAAIVVGAAIANGSWWYTYLSPIGMLAAAGATSLAMVFCSQALSALDTYCACVGPRCAGACDNLRNVLRAAMTVLGIQATACLTVAAYAWIPGAANPAQWVIIGSMLVQAALIISAIAFYSALAACGASPPAPPGPPAPTQPPRPPVEPRPPVGPAPIN
ncbi:MAG: hypothetical protein JNJ89_03690 [Rubrivivax sp.]|nr:hypothetical protein [Rubrivivax sp.]